MLVYFQVGVAVLTVAGAAFGSYVGIKVALAEIRGKLLSHDQQFVRIEREREDHDERIKWLERRGGINR